MINAAGAILYLMGLVLIDWATEGADYERQYGDREA